MLCGTLMLFTMMHFPCDLWELDADANSNGSAHGNANGTGNGHSPLTCGSGMWDVDAIHHNAISL